MAENNFTTGKAERGGFFAVDRRAWNFVCKLGMNSSVAYIVAARGTGGDNRTTKWSVNAIEARTGISRSRAREAIERLEKAGALRRDPTSGPILTLGSQASGESAHQRLASGANQTGLFRLICTTSKPNYPKYKLTPTHEIEGCEGYPLPPLDAEHTQLHAALGDDWVEVPASVGSRQRWGTSTPLQAVWDLVRTGHAEARPRNRFRAIRVTPEAAALPDWIWLPNTLVDGVKEEVAPLELVRQTSSAHTLRLLVNLYGAHNLDEDGGVNFRYVRRTYKRYMLSDNGRPLVVWGFKPDGLHADEEAPFVTPHVAGVVNDNKRKEGLGEFWECWRRLDQLGLIEMVAYLLQDDTPEGEILFPVPEDTGLQVERDLGDAAMKAALAMITPKQEKWAEAQGITMAVPIHRHLEAVQMVEIARLRYRPLTNRTLAFMAREHGLKIQALQFGQIAKIANATSR